MSIRGCHRRQPQSQTALRQIFELSISETERQNICNVMHLKVDETPGQYDHRIFEWIVMGWDPALVAHLEQKTSDADLQNSFLLCSTFCIFNRFNFSLLLSIKFIPFLRPPFSYIRF
jgi:hypothetical protein